jgi:tetratricopeptide (TPR) repeat protein
MTGRAVANSSQMTRSAGWRIGSRPAFLFLLVTYLLVGCASSQQKAERHLEQAEHWAAKGKLGEATLEYRRAIQLDPKSLKARLALAKIFMDRQDYAAAYQQFDSVRKNMPDNREERLMMADLTFRTGNVAEAEKDAQVLVDQSPDDVEALAILAESALAAKDTKLASFSADHILQIDPRNSRGWYLKAILQHVSGDDAESEKSLRNAIAYAPDSIPPVIALAALRGRAGDVTEVETVIRHALASNPENVQVHYLLAEFLLEQNRGNEAQEVFRQIKTLDDGAPTNRGALARYFVISGDTKAAVKEYQEIIQRHPDDVQNSLQLAAVYIELGQNSDAEQLLSSIGKRSPNDPKMLLFRGRLRVEEGQIEDGIRDLRHVAQMQPQWALAQYFLGLAYLREGKLDLAEPVFSVAAQLDQSLIAPRMILAQLALNEDKPEAAITAIGEALKEKPKFVEPYLLRSLALAQEGRLADAEKDALPLIDQFPEPPARAMTFRALAWAELQQKRFEGAHRFASESLKYDATSQEGLYLLGVSEIVLNRADNGLAEVEGYVRSNPAWAPGYEVLGQLQRMAGHPRDAEVSFRKAIEVDPKLVGAELRLSDLAMNQGKLDEAMDLLSQVAQVGPEMAAVDVRMGQLSEMKGNWKGAENYYSKALAIDAGNLLAKNNLAWVYAEHGGNLDVGLKLAQEAKEAKPDSSEISDTLAWILVKKQSYGTAIQLLQDCVLKDPGNPLFSYHLGVAYYRSGRDSEAEQYLQTALKLQPDFPYAGDAKQILEVLKK